MGQPNSTRWAANLGAALLQAVAYHAVVQSPHGSSTALHVSACADRGLLLVEDRVQRSNQDAASPVQVEAGWESAIACLKTVLEGGFETVAAAASCWRSRTSCCWSALR